MKQQETKRCNRCKNLLPVDRFSLVRKKKGNGKVYVFPKPYCKDCLSAEAVKRTSEKRAQETQNRKDRYCATCSTVLPKKYSHRMYCSAACQRKAAYLHKKASSPKQVTFAFCRECGEPFQPKSNRNVYCSDKCFTRADNRRQYRNMTDEKRERERARLRAYSRTEKGRERNRRSQANRDRDKENARKKLYQKTPVGRTIRRVIYQRRRTRERNAVVDYSPSDWRKALDYFDNKCAYCGEVLTVAEQEHFVPLARGGGYTKDNIIPACRKCNGNKRDLDPIEWLSSQVFGLIAYARVMLYFETVKP